MRPAASMTTPRLVVMVSLVLALLAAPLAAKAQQAGEVYCIGWIIEPCMRNARRPGEAPDEVSPVRSPIYGRMFWFSRKKFVGSCLRLSARSRSYLASP